MSLVFSEIAEIALVAARLGQFLQFLKTSVILILNFTRPHAITHTNIIGNEILLQPFEVALDIFRICIKNIEGRSARHGDGFVVITACCEFNSCSRR